MKLKELNETFIMISSEANPLVSIVFMATIKHTLGQRLAFAGI